MLGQRARKAGCHVGLHSHKQTISSPDSTTTCIRGSGQNTFDGGVLKRNFARVTLAGRYPSRRSGPTGHTLVKDIQRESNA